MIFDALYGQLDVPQVIDALIWAPEVQRLRHVFLSNVPSFDLPGIAQVTRFEHSIGTWHLAKVHSESRHLSQHESTILQVAALLHDIAMPGLGHLMEEGFGLAGQPFDHESHLDAIFSGSIDSGGTAFQIFAGKEVGFRRILEQAKSPASSARNVLACIRGNGPLGLLIKGSVDLDNLDNVTRIAYHMGLDVDRTLPIEIAKAISIVNGQLALEWSHLSLIEQWQDLRQRVYQRLMFSPNDFAAKTMLVRMLAQLVHLSGTSAVWHDDWQLTYEEFITKLRRHKSPIRRTFERLYEGDLFETVGLFWVEGSYPGLANVLELESHIKDAVGADCWLYAIPDKRHRSVPIFVTDRNQFVSVGKSPTGWLLGVCSPKSLRSRASALTAIRQIATRRFQTDVVLHTETTSHDVGKSRPLEGLFK